MRFLLAAVIALSLVAPVSSAPSRNEPASAEAVLAWINSYRTRPELSRVPTAVHALSRAGAFKDPESGGVYVGFIAGILYANPTQAEKIIGRLLPFPPEQQWAIVRAIAYSGLPRWKGLLHGFSMQMPGRKAMIDKYLSDQLPTLDHMVIEYEEPGFFEQLRNELDKDKPKKLVLEPMPDTIDTLWGFYFATGMYEPLSRIIAMLPWSTNDDDVEKLTLGGMAKYTMASNAARDPELLKMLKWAVKYHEKRTADLITEVIDAAETAETAKLRRDALAAIEEIKRKGPGSKRRLSKWGQLGQGALSLGCIAAAVGGAVVMGLPCVVGGALSSAALNYLSQPE